MTRQNVDTTLDNTDVILEQLKPPETAEADAGTPGRAVGRRRGEGHAEGLAAFAGSLKDLEAFTRGRLIAVVFYALAAVTASVGQIAS